MNLKQMKSLSIDGIVLKELRVDGSVAWKKSRLPSEYQEVEYIATDGNQAINTLVLASDYGEGIRYVFRGNVTKYNNSIDYWFGALASGCRSGNCFANGSNGLLGILVGANGNNHLYLGLPDTNTDFELVFQGTPKDANNAIATLDGVQFKTMALTNSEMPNTNIYLFTANGTSAATLANRKYIGKLYGFSMDSVDGTPIRNFVPCYRKADVEIGLYDTVGNVFYTNIGTGTFTKGPDVN